MSVKPRRLPDEAKHVAILKSAVKLFLKKGFHNTTMDAIADAARVTKQTVYAHYHSKEELFKQMISELCRKHTPEASLLADPNKKVESLLFELGLGFFNMLTSPEGLAAARLVVGEATRYPKLSQMYYDSGTLGMMHSVADFLKQCNKRGQLSIIDAESAASYFIALLKGRYHLRMVLCIKPSPTNKEKEEHVQEVVQMFMALYGGKTPIHTRGAL
jgi:TetR/AcrR family transcriptional repressor of mexJK operon